MSHLIDPLRPIGDNDGPMRIAASDLVHRVGRRPPRDQKERERPRDHRRHGGEHDLADMWLPSVDPEEDHAGTYDDHGRLADGDGEEPPGDVPHIDARA